MAFGWVAARPAQGWPATLWAVPRVKMQSAAKQRASKPAVQNRLAVAKQAEASSNRRGRGGGGGRWLPARRVKRASDHRIFPRLEHL